MTEEDKILQEVTTTDYKYGFVTDIDSDTINKGLNEDVIRLISMKKNEPEVAQCPDAEIVMLDLAFWDDLFDKIGHGTTLGRPFQRFRVPTKIL